MKSPGHQHVVDLLKKTVEGLENGELSVERFSFRDDEVWSIKVVCGAGDAALDRGARVAAAAGAEAREAAIAGAGKLSTTTPTSLGDAYRPPTGADACHHCKARGDLREAGDLAWLCLACNRESMPFGAKRSPGG